jgi:pyruvate dehydrogenase (quinone)
MVKDLLDESSFDASPGSVIPTPVSSVAQRLVTHLRDRSDDGSP